MKKRTGVLFLIATLAASPLTSGAEDDRRLVHECVVNAPLEQVWAAYTTKAGLESWMVGHAEIDLKIGGKMRTQYSSKGPMEESKAITNVILSYEPMHMFSFRVLKPPQGFPFPNAITNMWTVVYFDSESDKTTRVKGICMGFGDDDESMKMREFFDRGNAVTL